MQNSYPILLIEDDEGDVVVTNRAFRDLHINNELVHFYNGSEALDYLKKAGNPRPCLVLLDLNTPKMHGTEFLEIIKKDQDLKDIPVITLTTSQNSQDITNCFKLGAAGYIVKPLDYKKFLNAVKIIDLYWLLSRKPNNNPTEESVSNIEICTAKKDHYL